MAHKTKAARSPGTETFV